MVNVSATPYLFVSFDVEIYSPGMFVLKSITITTLTLCINFCAHASETQLSDKNNFTSVSGLRERLILISGIADTSDRNNQISQLWLNLKIRNQIPFAIDDSVAFLFRGTATSVKWVGDFNRWSSNGDDYAGTQIGATGIWFQIGRASCRERV